MLTLIIIRSKSIRDQLSIKDQNPDSFSSSDRNPYIKRITEIRETVTKTERIRGVSARLHKCMTRNSLCWIHCLLALFLSVILGFLFYQLPHTRDGIEKRENLFHIIVFPNFDLIFVVYNFSFSRSFIQYIQYEGFSCIRSWSHKSFLSCSQLPTCVFSDGFLVFANNPNAHFYILSFVNSIFPSFFYLPLFFVLSGLSHSSTENSVEKFVLFFIIIVLAFSSCSSLFSRILIRMIS